VFESAKYLRLPVSDPPLENFLRACKNGAAEAILDLTALAVSSLCLYHQQVVCIITNYGCLGGYQRLRTISCCACRRSMRLATCVHLFDPLEH